MAKIFIFGGSGRVATDLIKDLVADGNTVTAAARHPENIIKLDGVTSDKLDLHSDVEDISFGSSNWSQMATRLPARISLGR